MVKKGKVGSAGRYGVRYGRTIRATVSKIESLERSRHVCPRCNMPYVVRRSSGVWTCKKCGNKFAGMSYYPKKE